MIIKNLSTNSKTATVTFSYDELRCINNPEQRHIILVIECM